MSGRVPCSPHAVSFGLGSRSVARGGEQATTTHGTLGSSSSSARHRRRRAPCAAASASVTRSPSPSPVKDKPAEAGAVWGSFYCKPLRQRRASSHPLSAGAAASEPSPRLRLLSGLLLVPTDRIEWMMDKEPRLRDSSISALAAALVSLRERLPECTRSLPIIITHVPRLLLEEPDAVAATVRTLRSFLPEFAMEALAAIDGGVFCTGGLTDARRRELQEAWESLGAEISSSYPGSKMDTAFLDLLPRRDAGHLLRLLKGFSPKPLAGVRWVTSAGSLHIGGTWSDLPSGGDVIVIDKRSLSAAQPLA